MRFFTSLALIGILSAYAQPAAAANAAKVTANAAKVTGSYLEARSCQVYTGPCFANAEASLTGHDAMLAWNIEEGKIDGQDLAGLSVILVARGDQTLGFNGFDDATSLKSVILVDERASAAQASALEKFARQHGGTAGQKVARVDKSPISMSLDTATLSGNLEAGKAVKLITRKARETDCICSNEVAYYPPLAKVQNFAAGVTIDGHFKGKGLGATWSIPSTRSAYMATFAY